VSGPTLYTIPKSVKGSLLLEWLRSQILFSGICLKRKSKYPFRSGFVWLGLTTVTMNNKQSNKNLSSNINNEANQRKKNNKQTNKRIQRLLWRISLGQIKKPSFFGSEFFSEAHSYHSGAANTHDPSGWEPWKGAFFRSGCEELIFSWTIWGWFLWFLWTNYFEIWVWIGGFFKIFCFWPRKLGKWLDEHLFQMGWNHRLGEVCWRWWIWDDEMLLQP